MMDPIPDRDIHSVDLGTRAPQWALMALDPSGERHLMVKALGSGHQSTALLFRGHGGGGAAGRLSVCKWNRAAYDQARMARPDREVAVARLLASSSGSAGRRFSRLLSSQDMAGGYRQSWWEFYNVGSVQDLSALVLEQPAPPLSFVFRIVRQCLEGIRCLNELDVFHMDLHTGNVFVHLDRGASYPDAVIGDFGYSRLPGEGPPEFSAWSWSLMNTNSQAGLSSPPGTYGYRCGFANREWRAPWDLEKFQFNMSEDLLDNLDRDDERVQLVFAFFKRMADMSKQDFHDRALPEAERPPLQDLTQLIQDARTLERLYADTASDKKALGELRGKLLDLLGKEPLGPLVFDDEQRARVEFRDYTESGLFRVVDLNDEGSIEAAEEELSALWVEGTAYVADYGDKTGSSSDDNDGTSPSSSETRESSPAGDPEQRRAPEEDGAERRTPSTSSRPSTRWSPSTRGLAEATAFAGGDASAVDGLLGARDHAERDQALVRDEHARRYRDQRLRELFRRR